MRANKTRQNDIVNFRLDFIRNVNAIEKLSILPFRWVHAGKIFCLGLKNVPQPLVSTVVCTILLH